MGKQKSQSQSLLSGAMLLMMTTIIVHVVGVIYKIPITAIIGTVGRGYFTTAYEIYTPLYAISMAGLPVAVSKMVSERMALKQFKEVRKIRAVVRKLYMATGISGTLLLMLLAYPYASYSKSVLAVYAIVAIAPSIFFCCMMSSYRGYYEGLRNMAPTGYSQLMEVIGKVIFGLILAKSVQLKALSQYHDTGIVFGRECKDDAMFASIIGPYSAAAAIIGVTIGTILGLIYLQIRHRVVGDGITEQMLESSPEPIEGKEIAKQLIKLAVPVVTSSLVLNVTNLIDAITIQRRLSAAIIKNGDIIKNMYHTQLTQSNIMDSDIKNFLYGAYGTALDFRTLIPTVIMTLGVSAIPVLSGAYATKDHEKMSSAIATVIKTATLIAVPTGFVMAVLAEPVLKILYVGTNAEASISITAPFVAVYGFFALILSISTPITNMLQAIGRADVPVKSLLVGAILKIACNFTLVGIPSINIKGAPVGTIICYFYIVSHNLYVLLKETGVKVNWMQVIVKPFVAGALAGAASYGLYELFMMILPAGIEGSRNANFTWATLISVVLSVFVWVVLIFVTKTLDKNDILGLPKGKKIAKVLEKARIIK